MYMKIDQNLKNSGIYCILNINNNKRYIGSSKNMYNRCLSHRSNLRSNNHQNIKLQNSWNKHKEEFFIITILEICKEEELLNREQFFIDTLKPEYNLTLIVERNILSKESRKKQSITRKRRIASGEIKKPYKKIYKYDLDGNYVCEYEGLKIACEKNNISHSSICRFLNGTYKKGGNFLWSYDYLNNLPKYEKPLDKIHVVDILTNTLVNEFKNVRECASFFNRSEESIRITIRNQSKFKKHYKLIRITA